MAKLHIEQQATPDMIYEYLDIIESDTYSSKNEVYDAAYDRGYSLGEHSKPNIPTTLRRLKIVEESDAQKLTELGRSLVQIMWYDRDLYYNILHFIYCTAYELDPTSDRLISWSYKHVTEKLYNESPIDSFSDSKQDFVDSVEYTARNESGPGFEVGESYSFSTTSMSGYQKYIEKLEPPVLFDDGRFRLRSFAPPELMLLAVDHIYRTKNLSTADYGDLLELTDEVRKELCVLCLLSDDYLDDMLEHTARNYDILHLESDYAIRLRLMEEVDLDYIL